MDYKTIVTAAFRASGLFVLGLYVPVLGQALALFTPVPLMTAYAGTGRREGVIALGVSSALVAGVFGWQAGAVLLFGFGLMAVGAAEGMRRKWKPEQAALLGGLLPVALAGILLAYYFVQVQKGPVAALERYMHDSLTEAAELYAKMGLREMADMITAASGTFVYYFVRLAPSLVIATAVAQAACCYGLARVLVLRGQGAPAAPGSGLFASWHAPDTWVWGLIASLAFVALPHSVIRIVGWNLALLYAVAYTVQGMAVVEYFFRKIGVPAFARGLLFALILALPLFVFLTALGVVDIWGDFRKVRVSEKRGSSGG